MGLLRLTNFKYLFYFLFLSHDFCHRYLSFFFMVSPFLLWLYVGSSGITLRYIPESYTTLQSPKSALITFWDIYLDPGSPFLELVDASWTLCEVLSSTFCLFSVDTRIRAYVTDWQLAGGCFVDAMCFRNFPYPSLRTFLYYSLSFTCALSFTSEAATPYVPLPRTRVDATLVGVSTELHYGGGIFPILISLFHFSNSFKLFTRAVYGLSICCTCSMLNHATGLFGKADSTQS
jgi:hypothetical protein